MRFLATLTSIPICVLLAQTAVGQDCQPQACNPGGTCRGLGDRCRAPRKVCKVVCEMKKVTTTCWCVECEEFCVPLPTLPVCGLRGCKSCDTCGGCGDCGTCACGGGGLLDGLGCNRPIVPPRCGEVRVRKKLVKKEITKEVPVYKCVVVDCCEVGACSGGGADPGYAAPPAREPTEAAPRMAPVEEEEAAPLPPAPRP